MQRRATATEVAKPSEILRKDYTPPPYWIREVQLSVKIFDGKTQVDSRLLLGMCPPSTTQGSLSSTYLLCEALSASVACVHL
eukprot:6468064-Amphidinium_carterae.1